MFSPDGRNSVQTIGHGVMSVAKFVMTVFGILALAPTFLFFIARHRLQVQEATIEALNDPGPKTAMLVDFNEATLGDTDGRIAQAWADARYPGLDPSLRTLPFQVTLLYRDRNGQWEPEEADVDRACWLYYNLPFDDRMIEDERFFNGMKANVWRIGQDNSEVMEPLKKVIAQHDLTASAFAYSDPWWTAGAFKLTPTKNWDWHSGFELVHAKASSNYRAYVGAARAVSRMRHLYACNATGVPFNIDWHSDTSPGRLVAKAGWRGDDFARAYRTAFKGGLPVVLLQLQDLNGKSIDHDSNWKRFQAIYGQDLDHNSDVGMIGASTTPFVTGMHLWSGYHAYGAEMGRLTFSYSDFFINTTPKVSPDAQVAQRALLQLMDDDFWFKFFPKEAHGYVHQILEAERTRLGRDTHFSRMLAHHAFYSRDAQ